MQTQTQQPVEMGIYDHAAYINGKPVNQILHLPKIQTPKQSHRNFAKQEGILKTILKQADANQGS
jgi:hypothetical protein